MSGTPLLCCGQLGSVCNVASTVPVAADITGQNSDQGGRGYMQAATAGAPASARRLLGARALLQVAAAAPTAAPADDTVIPPTAIPQANVVALSPLGTATAPSATAQAPAPAAAAAQLQAGAPKASAPAAGYVSSSDKYDLPQIGGGL